jgi:hypothetical protein
MYGELQLKMRQRLSTTGRHDRRDMFGCAVSLHNAERVRSQTAKCLVFPDERASRHERGFSALSAYRILSPGCSWDPKSLAPSARVNVEVDLIARDVERMLGAP